MHALLTCMVYQRSAAKFQRVILALHFSCLLGSDAKGGEDLVLNVLLVLTRGGQPSNLVGDLTNSSVDCLLNSLNSGSDSFFGGLNDLGWGSRARLLSIESLDLLLGLGDVLL